MRAALQRPCITAVTNDAPRGQTTARETEEPQLFTLFEEERGGTRPDRLSDVRPQERGPAAHRGADRRLCTELLVVAAPGLPTLELADVLPLVEAKEREEDARMEQLEDMMFSGQSVSAAGREAWRRWAQAGSTQRRRKRKKKKLPKTSLRHASPVPAVLRRVRGGASVPVHRQSGGYFSCFTEIGLTVQNCAKDRRFARCISWIGWDTPVVVQRQGYNSNNTKKNCGGSAVAVGAVLGTDVDAQLQFFRQVPMGSDSAENCLKGQLCRIP